MARPRKPTAVLEASGAFDHNPERRRARENEPVPLGPLGDPPEFLSDEAKSIWRELADASSPGVLTISDRLFMEIVCRQIAKHRAGKLTVTETNQIITCLGRMGFTPAARGRLKFDS